MAERLPSHIQELVDRASAEMRDLDALRRQGDPRYDNFWVALEAVAGRLSDAARLVVVAQRAERNEGGGG